MLQRNTVNPPQTILAISMLIEWCLKITLLLIIIPLIVPFSPKLPAPGLDASWALGLNQAVAQGLSFGKDIIFTLGPYSSVYTKSYHPATDLMMMGGCLYLALSYWLALILLLNQVKWRWILAFAALLAGMIYARDSLFFSYPLLTGLNCIRHANTTKNASNNSIIALLFAPLGLLCLVKGTLIILTILTIGLCCIFFLHYNKKKLALMCFLAPLVSVLFFWISAGQPILDLPAYFINSLTLASGFTEAMATEGNNQEIILYLLACGFILLAIALQNQTEKIEKIFILSLFLLFLFLSFKTGFTRHFGHSYITGTSILIAALILPLLFYSKIIIPIIIFSLYVTSYIDGQRTQISLLNNFVATYSSAWHGLKNRINDTNWARDNFNFTMSYLRQQASFPVLSGKTDIYSYDQTYLIASGMDWFPRPVFQSYSVFGAQMAKKNKEHLLGENSPEHIMFKVEPIDERIPSLEDGLSWPELLRNFHPVQYNNEFLVLTKNPNRKRATAMQLVQSAVVHFNEQAYLPDTTFPIFVEIEITPTLWGMMTSIFFKPPQLQATINLLNGTQRRYRIIANMAKSGFLLSPLIEDTAEFGLLFSSNQLIENKKVTSISITASPSTTKQWNCEYKIHFKQIIDLQS